ncbi:MAG: hypothetical protein L6Q33_07190 [Bacteriovoracaceae bacterium]|nr:hypothetical protein [Bacteriovoracaceae bacterium]
MNAFEEIVKPIFENEGYWCRSRHMVSLSKNQKNKIGKSTIPSIELDLIAFNSEKNECLVIEVKSYLNSFGVMFKDLKENQNKIEGRYKVFTNKNYRNEIFNALKKDLIKKGMIHKSTKMKAVLVAGKISGADEKSFEVFCKKNGFEFYGPKRIYSHFLKLQELSYVNEPTIMLLKFIEQIKTNEIKLNKIKNKT